MITEQKLIMNCHINACPTSNRDSFVNPKKKNTNKSSLFVFYHSFQNGECFTFRLYYITQDKIENRYTDTSILHSPFVT